MSKLTKSAERTKNAILNSEAWVRREYPKAVRSNATPKVNPNFVRARDVNFGSNLCEFDMRKVRRLENIAVSIAKENEKLSLSEVIDKLEKITKDL